MALQGCLKRANQHFGEERDFERESRVEFYDRTMTQIDRDFRMTFACRRTTAPRAIASDHKSFAEKIKIKI